MLSSSSDDEIYCDSEEKVVQMAKSVKKPCKCSGGSKIKLAPKNTRLKKPAKKNKISKAKMNKLTKMLYKRLTGGVLDQDELALVEQIKDIEPDLYNNLISSNQLASETNIDYKSGRENLIKKDDEKKEIERLLGLENLEESRRIDLELEKDLKNSEIFDFMKTLDKLEEAKSSADKILEDYKSQLNKFRIQQFDDETEDYGNNAKLNMDIGQDLGNKDLFDLDPFDDIQQIENGENIHFQIGKVDAKKIAEYQNNYIDLMNMMYGLQDSDMNMLQKITKDEYDNLSPEDKLKFDKSKIIQERVKLMLDASNIDMERRSDESFIKLILESAKIESDRYNIGIPKIKKQLYDNINSFSLSLNQEEIDNKKLNPDNEKKMEELLYTYLNLDEYDKLVKRIKPKNKNHFLYIIAKNNKRTRPIMNALFKDIQNLIPKKTKRQNKIIEDLSNKLNKIPTKKRIQKLFYTPYPKSEIINSNRIEIQQPFPMLDYSKPITPSKIYKQQYDGRMVVNNESRIEPQYISEQLTYNNELNLLPKNKILYKKNIKDRPQQIIDQDSEFIYVDEEDKAISQIIKQITKPKVANKKSISEQLKPKQRNFRKIILIIPKVNISYSQPEIKYHEFKYKNLLSKEDQKIYNIVMSNLNKLNKLVIELRTKVLKKKNKHLEPDFNEILKLKRYYETKLEQINKKYY